MCIARCVSGGDECREDAQVVRIFVLRARPAAKELSYHRAIALARSSPPDVLQAELGPLLGGVRVHAAGLLGIVRGGRDAGGELDVCEGGARAGREREAREGVERKRS